MAVLLVEKLSKSFPSGEHRIVVLNNISFEIKPNEFVAITGHSGSGKTTLLSLLVGLERPDTGKIYFKGKELTAMSEEELALFRQRHVGFVFQNYELFPSLTALENVELPLQIRREKKVREKAEMLLSQLGLKERLHHLPSQLSGGEQQRVAIARALVSQPDLILADEPTGNLDEANGKLVMEILLKYRQSSALLLVTHNSELAHLAERQIVLKSGTIVKEIKRKRKNVSHI
ncbi:MAG: ABC transporter ATP-binding protein [Leptospiraceae bacterium]|nr:ABC transporter ATP-binding protein [Leptospiraceae bacterium]MDW8305646.1 ABC transporter ATP-binding protein [Leptospiraceae bacterium]